MEEVNNPGCLEFMTLDSEFDFSTARIFFAKGKVMAKALGLTPEEEHCTGIHKLAKVRLSLAQFFKSWASNEIE